MRVNNGVLHVDDSLSRGVENSENSFTMGKVIVTESWIKVSIALWELRYKSRNRGNRHC